MDSYTWNLSYPVTYRHVWHRLYFDICFYLRAFQWMRGRKDMLIIAMTDPPLLPLVAALSGTRYVVWMQDVFPDIAVKAGVLPEWIATPIRWAMQWALRRAKRVVVIGRCMQAHLKTWGIESVVIPNWVDSRKWPYTKPAGPKRAYLGRAGVIHGFHGHAVTNLPDEEFTKACQDAQTHIVTLKQEMCGLSVPSKVYTALACGRWVEWHGPLNSEAYLIAKEARAIAGYWTTSRGIRKYFEEHCDRKVQTEKWHQLLSSLPSR